MAPCFSNQWNQAVHKYANFVLVLFIAALSWWLIQVDARGTKNMEELRAVQVEAASAKARNDALLARLDAIDMKLTLIDQRIYSLFGARGPGSIP